MRGPLWLQWRATPLSTLLGPASGTAGQCSEYLLFQAFSFISAIEINRSMFQQLDIYILLIDRPNSWAATLHVLQPRYHYLQQPYSHTCRGQHNGQSQWSQRVCHQVGLGWAVFSFSVGSLQVSVLRFQCDEHCVSHTCSQQTSSHPQATATVRQPWCSGTFRPPSDVKYCVKENASASAAVQGNHRSCSRPIMSLLL